jgi:phage-related minor tail protein
MGMLKKKTRKAIQKSFKKLVNKHGPTVAEHLATALATALTTYLAAEGKKGGKQIKKIVKHLPGGKHLARAADAVAPAMKSAAEKLPGLNNGHEHRKKRRHSKSANAS